jgi:uncharacterized protein (TIGR03790 family)
VQCRAFVLLLFAADCFGQAIPLRERVLILVNDRVRESVDIGRYYAERRQIPQGNILHLKTNTAETMLLEEYKEQIENPLRKFLDANNGAMRRKVVYIVPIYGIPVKVPDKFAVDSLIGFMYAGHETDKPPLRNPYHGPTGSRPPHFAEWSDGVAAANNFKMFAVTRLDGPGPEIAKALVDKAIEGEKIVNVKTGIAYFDYQGSRHKDEWQWAIDDEVRDGAERARTQGFQTVLHTQYTSPCHAMIQAATQYLWDPARKQTVVNAPGGPGSLNFPLPALEEAEFTAQLENITIGLGSNVTLTLGATDKNQVRLFYPFTPFRDWELNDEVVLEKVVDGAVAARAVLKVNGNDKAMNTAGELKLSVRKGRITAYRNGVELIAVDDNSAKSGKPLALTSAGITASCWMFGIRGLHVQDASGKPVWSDDFASDAIPRYQWKTSSMGGSNAQWVWGWYGFAHDSYRFLPGAVGSQLTSFTADRIRRPFETDPKKFSFAADRWKGNWVPRMLEQGVTATWGAVTEPYATFYARGPNVFDHMWAGYNFGDSFYIAENAARWVMVAIGDPLYAPAAFARR